MQGFQKRYLRSLGHSLRPLVQLGKDSITDNVIKQIEQNLVAHELIKVKLPKTHREERLQLADDIVKQTESELVQVVGRIIILYRPHPDKPVIQLPKTPKAIPQK